MTSTSIQSRSLSPYIAVLETELSEDLRKTIPPEEVREAVRAALLRELLRQALVAIQEMDNAITWDKKNIDRAEVKLSRHLGYVQELLGIRVDQRIDASMQIRAVSPESTLEDVQ